jgi:hypothetical protein
MSARTFIDSNVFEGDWYQRGFRKWARRWRAVKCALTLGKGSSALSAICPVPVPRVEISRRQTDTESAAVES